MKKRLLGFILVIVIIVGLTGCGNSNNSSADFNNNKNEASNNTNSSSDNKKSGEIEIDNITIKYGTYDKFEFDRGTQERKAVNKTLILKENGKCEYEGDECTYIITKFDFGDSKERECIKILVNTSYGSYEYYYYPIDSNTLTDDFSYEFKYSK